MKSEEINLNLYSIRFNSQFVLLSLNYPEDGSRLPLEHACISTLPAKVMKTLSKGNVFSE